MSFGNRYVNKFMIDFEDGWSVTSFKEWAESNHWDISPVENSLHNPSYPGHPVLMLYTLIESENSTQLHGYFTSRDEATGVYAPEGWEFIAATPEEIIV